MVLALSLLGGCQEYKIGTPPPDDSDFPATVYDTADPPTPTDEPAPTEPNVDAPTVTCDASEYIVAPPYDSVDLTASATDPQGLEITGWQWTKSAGPGGSDAVPTPGNAQNATITPDLAGVYELSVVATNSAGVSSEPCTVQVESISAQDLRVEMFWDQNGDDMDLHLLAPGGTFQTSSDCYYINCKASAFSGLDWGVQNFADDDPVLDLDDIDGDGPENINIIQPENGVYTVIVHDYGNDPSIASTNVTVNIYLDGQLTWTDTRNITGDLTENRFAEIHWATRSVVGL